MRTPSRLLSLEAILVVLLVGHICSCKDSGDTGDAGADALTDVGRAGTDALTDVGSASDDGRSISAKWVTIAAGTFTMGSPTSEPCRWPTGEDQHKVTLTHKFEIQTTEVTQGQFQALMGYNTSYFGPTGSKYGKGPNCGKDCPVDSVYWHHSAAYCNELSSKKGYTQCYDCKGRGKDVTCAEKSSYKGPKIYTCSGYRLPTEAEWEYAYRAGTTTAYYAGPKDPKAPCLGCTAGKGKDPVADKIGWYCGNGGGQMPHRVGQKQPNAWGLYDMAGNLFEWCHDHFKRDLGFSAVTDPSPVSGSLRVVRGGAYSNVASYMRAARRIALDSVDGHAGTGFRCVRSL